MKRMLAVLVLVGLTVVPTTARAGADPFTPAQLGSGTLVEDLTSFWRMAVSDDYVFLAEGATGSHVAVMDLDGSQVDTIGGVPDPMGLAVDGSTLYVAARGASAIFVYDVGTLPATKIATLSTLPIEGPTSLALSSGRLWFTGKDPADPYPSLGSMTKAGTGFQAFFPGDYQYWQYGQCGDIDQSPFAAGRLFVHGNGCGSPDALYLYGSGSATPDPLSSYGLDDEWGQYNSEGIAALPGGGMVVRAGNEVQVRDLDDLSGPTASYVPPRRWQIGNAITTSASGLLATSAAGGSSILLWDVGQTDAINGFILPDGEGAPRNSLAFSPVDPSLFVVGTGSGGVRFHVVDPSQQGSSLDLHASRRKPTFGQAITLTVTLTGPKRGQLVRFEQERRGVIKQLGTCETDRWNKCEILAKPSEFTTYRASFAGIDGWAPSTSEPVKVEVGAAIVGRMLRGYRTVAGYTLFHESQRVFYSTTMKPHRPGKKLVIFLEYNFGSGWKNGGKDAFKQGRGGNVKIYFESHTLPQGQYRLRTSFSGERFLSAGTSDQSYFRVTG